MDKTVALRNGSSILLLISVLLGAGIQLWQNRETILEKLKKMFNQRNKTKHPEMYDFLAELLERKIEEEKNK